MTGHGSKFGRKKEAAIAALLTQRNIEEAAKSAGIGTQTLMRWLKMPEFQTEYLEARRAAVSQANARLQQASGPAVSTLCRIMVDPNVPPAVRTRTAFYIISLSKQSIQEEDVLVRVGVLERDAKLAKPPEQR
jgi:transposase-like protein